MEVTEHNLTALAGYLQQTVNPDLTVRKQGILESMESYQNYPHLLLQLLDKDNVEPRVHDTAAINFQNYVKRNWKVTEDLGDKIDQTDWVTIKQQIPDLMLKRPERVQKELSDAFCIIGMEDFPDFIHQLVSMFENKNCRTVNVGLMIAHSLCKRDRHVLKSRELRTENKLMMHNLTPPLTNLFNKMMDLAKTQATNPDVSKFSLRSIALICKIFYSLNLQSGSNAIQFRASMAESCGYKNPFEDPETLASICEIVIVPNIRFQDADKKLFEYKPEEYIRQDIEGSDIDSRRRSTCGLVHTLCKSFEGPVIQNFSQYVETFLQEFAKDPVDNWKSKEAAIYLVTSLVAKDQTQKHGVMQSSILVNVEEFYTNQILPHLQNPNIDEQEVLRADSLKYLTTFRNQLPKEVLVAGFLVFIKSLQAKSPVVHTYAAHAIEQICTVKNTTEGALITITDLQASAHELIVSLIGAMQHPGSYESEYIMKAIMRSLSMLQSQILPMVNEIVKSLAQELQDVIKNPSKPHFNHYLFESLCICIRSTCKTNPEAVGSFEEALFPSLINIIKQDLQKFFPYVFQVMSILIELHKGALSNMYMELFPFLLNPVLWKRQGNIPPLVRLVQAYLRQGASLVEAEKLKDVLEVFNKLIASKTHDHEGLNLIDTFIEFAPILTLGPVVEPFLKKIFVLLFQRLQRSKTTKLIKSVLVFFSLYAVKIGAPSLVQMIDGIQAGMFGMVIEKLYLTDLQKVSGHIEKKICAVGVIKILTESPVFLQEYQPFWVQLLEALIKLFEFPEDESVPDNEHFVEIEDTSSYQTAYFQLEFAPKPVHDPLEGVDPKLLLAKNLETLSAEFPGKLSPMIASELPEESQTFLHQYLQAAGANLA